MSDRIAWIVVLAEDQGQVNLVRRYLQRSIDPNQRITRISIVQGRGSGEQFVRKNYAKEVNECRQRAATRSALLIVAMDADENTVEDRARQLADELRARGFEARSEDDPIAVLIPKRNVETWILCLNGKAVNENDDYSATRITGLHLTEVARTLFCWTRNGAEVPARCVSSLRDSFPEWRRIERPANR